MTTISAADEPTTADPDSWLASHRVTAVNASLDSLTGLERPKKAITRLAYALLHPDEIRAAGGSVPRAILLAGPVGCGKTSLARALAGLVAAQVAFFELVASELSPEHVAAIVHYADRSITPVAVFIDELSWLGLDRRNPQQDPESRAALYAVLSAVSGLRDPGHAPVVWIGATSDDPDTLDEALTRSGRFSHIVEVRRPGRATRRLHLERLLERRRTAGPVDLDRLVELTAARSYADLEQLVDDALAQALADGGPTAGIDQADLEDAASAAGHTDDAPEFNRADRWRIAVHEAAHALVGEALEPGSVRAISPINHRGATTTLEPEGQSPGPMSDAALQRRVTILLAGAVGERLMFPDEGASTGCADDARRAGEILLGRLSSGVDPAWAAPWPSWIDVGPAYADRRAAAIDAIQGQLADRAEVILRAHRAGLELIAELVLADGDLAGPALRAALDEALSDLGAHRHDHRSP